MIWIPRGDLEAAVQYRNWLASAKGKLVPCRPEGSLHLPPSVYETEQRRQHCLCASVPKRFPGFGKRKQWAG